MKFEILRCTLVDSIAVDRESKVWDWIEMAQWFLEWVDDCQLLKACVGSWFWPRGHKSGDCRAAVLPQNLKQKKKQILLKD